MRRLYFNSPKDINDDHGPVYFTFVLAHTL